MRKLVARSLVAGGAGVLGLAQTAWAGVAGLTPLFAQEEAKRNYTFQSLLVVVVTAIAVLVICKPTRRQL